MLLFVMRIDEQVLPHVHVTFMQTTRRLITDINHLLPT